MNRKYQTIAPNIDAIMQITETGSIAYVNFLASHFLSIREHRFGSTPTDANNNHQKHIQTTAPRKWCNVDININGNSTMPIQIFAF